MIDAQQEIEALTAFDARQPGSDSERRAANHLKRRLQDLGREAHVQPVVIWPRWYVAHLLHALLAIAGSAISVKSAVVGATLVGIAAVSTVGDLTGRLPLIRRLTGRRASQNVLSPESSPRRGTLILAAHYDTGRTGAAFGRLSAIREAIASRIRREIGPAEPFTWALGLLVITSAARVAGLHNTVLAVVQFIPTAALIIAVPYLVDFALTGPSPGANDNASGVATVLRLAERYGGVLEHVDVWVLLTGAQEAGSLGIRGWLKQHRESLDSRTTIVLNVDEVGAGNVRYASKEGPLIALRQHPRLIALCRQLEQEDEDERRYRVEPVAQRRTTDAYAARVRGLPAVTVSCAPAPHHHRETDTAANVEDEALERAFGFSSELIELIDEEIGPDLSGIVAQTGDESFTPS